MKWALWMAAVGLYSAGPVQAQSIECTFLDKEGKESLLLRWVANLGPKPPAHHWHAVTSYHNGSDAGREVAYMKHVGATNTAAVAFKSNYETDVQSIRPGSFDFYGTAILSDLAKDQMAANVAGQHAGPSPVNLVATSDR